MGVNMNREPKILLWDVENSHNIVATFGLYNTTIRHENVLQPWFMICAAWKWLGQSKINSVSLLDDTGRFKEDYTDDYHVIETLHKVLSEADAVIAHNGDRFDLRKFNARAVQHGLDPIPPVVQIDTLKIARKHFCFNYNKLDYLGHYLGVGQKVNVNNQLWLDCLVGKPKAIREMVRYNKGDITLLEDVFRILAPYADAKLNFNHFFGDGHLCPTCGSDNLQRRGWLLTRASKKQRFHCQSCGSWSSAPESNKGIVR
jgi:hypothetical protein